VHGDVLQLNLQELIDRVTHAAEAEAQQQEAASSSAGTLQPQEQTQQQRSKRRKVKVVANLPYNITKDFLVAMFPKGDLIAELSIMIQVRVLGHAAALPCVPAVVPDMLRHAAAHLCISALVRECAAGCSSASCASAVAR
jgi:16S rRNA A1518/A1519 N6-dimethyltransferase RsmA/KsgA/DIM1 with predicted DNA glycosylase/AP lyase activity